MVNHRLHVLKKLGGKALIKTCGVVLLAEDGDMAVSFDNRLKILPFPSKK